MRNSSVVLLMLLGAGGGAGAVAVGWRWRGGCVDTTAMSSRSLCATPPRYNSLEEDGDPYSYNNLDQRTQRQLLLGMGALFEQLRALSLQRGASPSATSPAERIPSSADPSSLSVDADPTPSFRWNDLESPENIARFRDEMDRMGSSRLLLSSGPRHAASPKTASNGTVAQQPCSSSNSSSRMIRAAGRKKVWKDSMRLTRTLQQQQQGGGRPMGDTAKDLIDDDDLDAAVSIHLRGALLRAVDELLPPSSGGQQRLPNTAVERKQFQVQRIAEVGM